MAKFIINSKVYDTNKMELIGKVCKVYPFSSFVLKAIYGESLGYKYDCDLYRSINKNFLLVHKETSGYIGEAVSEDEAKSLLMRFDYDAYVKLYGELEEA